MNVNDKILNHGSSLFKNKPTSLKPIEEEASISPQSYSSYIEKIFDKESSDFIHPIISDKLNKNLVSKDNKSVKLSSELIERELLYVRDSTKVRLNLSFYNGKPQTAEAIERMTDPFYICEKTIKLPTTYVADGCNTGKNKGGEIRLINTLEIKSFTSMFMTILQIINSIIRYTIVQFPYCIRVLGLIYGPIIISVIGIMSIYSIYMLIEIKNYTQKK